VTAEGEIGKLREEIQKQEQALQNAKDAGRNQEQTKQNTPTQDEILKQTQQNSDVSEWKQMFEGLKAKFEQLRQVNSKLIDSIEALTPEAEKSDEYKKLIAEIEQGNKELDSCIGNLSKDNQSLVSKMESVENEVKGLSQKLNDTVHKSEYEALTASKHDLELKADSLRKELEEKNTEFSSLEKNYMWLEKEYNALYENASQGAS